MKAQEKHTEYAKIYYMNRCDNYGNRYAFVFTHPKVYHITLITGCEDMALMYCYTDSEHFEITADLIERKEVRNYTELKREFKRLTAFVERS